MPRDFRENLVPPTATILTTLRIIDSHGVPIGLVHDNGKLLGTVTDGDIRRGILAGLSLDAPVTRVMNREPTVMLVGVSNAAVLAMMRKRSLLYIPLVDGANHIHDLKVLKDLRPTAAAVGNPVLLMAGGRGNRLRPETEERPKPMLEVDGKPILETIVERFVAQGFTRIFISVNYKREMIENYFGNGSKWRTQITYVHESAARGTAGALALLPERPTQPLVVMNGDLLTTVSFANLVRFHEDLDAPATMSVSQHHFTVPYGVVESDQQFMVRIEEKPVHKFSVNAGIYVIGPEAIDLVPDDRACDMPELFSLLLTRAEQGQGRRPAVFPLHEYEYWIDIGQHDDLNRARREFRGLLRQE